MEKMEMLYLISQMLKIDLTNKIEISDSKLKIDIGKTPISLKLKKI